VAQGYAPGPTPGSARSRDADGGELRQLPSRDSPPRIFLRPDVGNWPCACGREYRVLTEPLTFWPRNSQRGFRVEPTETCIECGADLEETFALEAARLVSAAMLR
jgi:hypothetical protein